MGQCAWMKEHTEEAKKRRILFDGGWDCRVVRSSIGTGNDLVHAVSWMRPVLRVWSPKVKHDEEWGPRRAVAKRLTKALRGKRRWVGVVFPPSIRNRSEAEARIEELKTTLGEPKLQLMDFIPSHRRGEECTLTEMAAVLAEETGLGIVRTPLPTYPRLRALIGGEDALQAFGVSSLTASGKIRLVRERLGLPKPKRK